MNRMEHSPSPPAAGMPDEDASRRTPDIDPEDARKRMVEDLTSFLLRKHYCENDVDAIISLFEEPFSWFGAGEQEYAQGVETVSRIFLQFAGQVPRCSVTDEEYDAFALAPDVYFCTGRLWIATDPSTGVCLRVHQRVTTIFRFLDGAPRCCHIHISNPYVEMAADDVGFPTRMAQQSREFLQSQLEEQRLRIEAQAAELRRLSFEDSLTELHNRNRFNQDVARLRLERPPRLGVACFDLNGLKEINDQLGHLAGDDLLRRAARQIRRVFPHQAYRAGGDEFVVLDQTLDSPDFEAAVERVCRNLRQDGISCAAGLSWRGGNCRVMEQLMEADQRMYGAKQLHYRQRGVPRRNPRRTAQ